MGQFEIYLLIFTDSLVSNLAINPYTGIAVITAKTFGSLYNAYMISLVATLSVPIAFSMNYVLGVACYKILSPMGGSKAKRISSARINMVKENRLILLVLLLSFVPFFGKFLILFAGICRIPFSRTIMIGTLSKALYYVIV